MDHNSWLLILSIITILLGIFGTYKGAQKKESSFTIAASSPEELVNPVKWLVAIIFKILPNWAPGLMILGLGLFFLSNYFKNL